MIICTCQFWTNSLIYDYICFMYYVCEGVGRWSLITQFDETQEVTNLLHQCVFSAWFIWTCMHVVWWYKLLQEIVLCRYGVSTLPDFQVWAYLSDRMEVEEIVLRPTSCPSLPHVSIINVVSLSPLSFLSRVWIRVIWVRLVLMIWLN